MDAVISSARSPENPSGLARAECQIQERSQNPTDEQDLAEHHGPPDGKGGNRPERQRRTRISCPSFSPQHGTVSLQPGHRSAVHPHDSLPASSLLFCGTKSPAFRHGDETPSRYANLCASIRALVAAGEHRFSTVLKVQASISLRIKPVESARTQSPWGSRAWVAKPEKPRLQPWGAVTQSIRSPRRQASRARCCFHSVGGAD